ncbi:hypothetical protein HYFRA_00005754 [Hymenoscyphus fraxineus]|uniref:Uncharacterized protein n=1 Tax=Hymenoscyphus fraxineus TaxID=746836 RepID=A0A9N9KTX9_9HELO|nr:hypothetical protein HYFRA_00005754 [Hymenoscyphus fraxineus]
MTLSPFIQLLEEDKGTREGETYRIITTFFATSSTDLAYSGTTRAADVDLYGCAQGYEGREDEEAAGELHFKGGFGFGF